MDYITNRSHECDKGERIWSDYLTVIVNILTAKTKSRHWLNLKTSRINKQTKRLKIR